LFRRETQFFSIPSGEWASDIELAANGGIIVGGGISMPGGTDILVSRYDPSGARAWTRQIGSPANEELRSVSLDSSERIYLGGSAAGRVGAGSFGGYDFVSARLNADGSVDWLQQLGTSHQDFFHSQCVAPNGNLYYSGYTQGSIGSPNPNARYRAVIMRQNPNSGASQWTRTTGTDTTSDIADDIACDATGRAFVTGLVGSGASPGHLFAARYDANGNLAWQQSLDGYSSAGEKITVAPDGSVLVTGHSYASFGALDQVVVAKFSSSGALLWNTIYGDDDAIEYGNELAVDDAGNVFVAGHSQGNLGGINQGNYDVFLAKHAGDGTLLWVKSFGDSVDNYVYDIRVNPSGDVDLAWLSEGGISVTRFSAVVPEPASILHCISALVLGGMMSRIRSKRLPIGQGA
jgi:uncharacterized delta-60 repeat protein